MNNSECGTNSMETFHFWLALQVVGRRRTKQPLARSDIELAAFRELTVSKSGASQSTLSCKTSLSIERSQHPERNSSSPLSLMPLFNTLHANICYTVKFNATVAYLPAVEGMQLSGRRHFKGASRPLIGFTSLDDQALCKASIRFTYILVEPREITQSTAVSVGQLILLKVTW